MHSADKATYKILLADDSQDDRFFVQRVVQRFQRFQIVGEAQDGEECISYLSGKPPFNDRAKFPLPDLLLLDLKMPKRDGFDVLKWLRDKSFHKLTVVVLSGSILQQDIGASLALGAHGFWTKAATAEKHDQIAREIETLMDLRNGKIR
jgi:CheY-like chemotaxis protein